VNGTTFMCLASIHHQNSNMNFVISPREYFTFVPQKWHQKCYHYVNFLVEEATQKGNHKTTLELKTSLFSSERYLSCHLVSKQ
jgi:hypothetical protein